jgi:hypothetical protein
MIELPDLSLRIYGHINQSGDDTTYDLTFFEHGEVVLRYNMDIEREDVHIPYVVKLDPVATANAVLDFLVDISVLEVEELINLFGDNSDWYFDNQELVESLEASARELIKNNEGWDSYGLKRFL